VFHKMLEISCVGLLRRVIPHGVSSDGVTTQTLHFFCILFLDVLPSIISHVPADTPALVYVSATGPVVRGDRVAGDATMLPSA
jgi:hypothetical protein